MAITTLDGAISGMLYPRMFAKEATGTLVAGRPHSLWMMAGAPSAGTTPVYPITGAGVSTQAGGIPFDNPTSGSSSTYLARFTGSATIAGTLMLCDRVWMNSGVSSTHTSYQAIAGVTIDRDAYGGVSGYGVLAGIEIYATTGAGTPTITLRYTNAEGVTGCSAQNITPTVASSIRGAFYFMGLNSGNIAGMGAQGIRKVEGIQLSATWSAGTSAIGVTLYRPIAFLELPLANTPNALDMITSGFPKLYNYSHLFLVFIPNTTTTSYIQGSVVMTQG
jgi:hypothetical protein